MAHRRIAIGLTLLKPTLFTVNWLSAFQPQRHDPDLRAVPLGFLGLIFFGGLLLALPWSVAEGKSLGWLDAFFLSVSAVCVTGLSPVDVATTLSGFGQAVLLLLVQLGGIGIVTASLALVMLGGRRLTLADEGAVAATIGKLQRAKPAQLFRQSCLVVILCEAAGASLIYSRLRTVDPDGDVFTQLWQSIFHAISAFCNAGFSILPAGLASWRETSTFSVSSTCWSWPVASACSRSSTCPPTSSGGATPAAGAVSLFRPNWPSACPFFSSWPGRW